MAKIIIVNAEKPNFDAHEILTTLVDFSVIKKDEEKFEISVNTDKGWVKLILERNEVDTLVSKLLEERSR